MAAIVLKQSNPGFIDRQGVGADLLDKEIDLLRMRYNKQPYQGLGFFRTVTPKGGVYKESTWSDVYELPVSSEDSEKLRFVQPMKGFPKSFTTTEYRSAVQIERRLLDEQIEPLARRLAGGLMNSGRLLLEYSAADIWNQATTAAAVGADGVCLANASHPHARRQTGTWSNVETSSAITPYTYGTARKNLRKRPNEFGYPNPMFPRMLVTGPDKETEARTVVATEKVAGTALNDKFVWANEVQVVIWDYQTSTTAWGLFANIPEEYKGMVYGEEVAPNLAPCTGADTSTDIVYGERLRMIFMMGFTVCPELQYNAGA